MKKFLLTFAVAISSYSIAYADVAEDIKSNIQKLSGNYCYSSE